MQLYDFQKIDCHKVVNNDIFPVYFEGHFFNQT